MTSVKRSTWQGIGSSLHPRIIKKPRPSTHEEQRQSLLETIRRRFVVEVF
jgi:hypothetical protein